MTAEFSAAAPASACARLFASSQSAQELSWTYYLATQPTKEKCHSFRERAQRFFRGQRGVSAACSPRYVRLSHAPVAVRGPASTFEPDPLNSSEVQVLDEPFRETAQILDYVYSTYTSRDTVPDSWVSMLRDMDKALPPENINYLVFRDPESQDPRIAIRIFDASPTSAFKSEGAKPTRLPLEIEYPNLVLPDRKTGHNHLLEFGRLAKDPAVTDATGPFMHALALYLEAAHAHTAAVLYVEGSRVAARYYRSMGFDLIAGPEVVQTPDTYILRMTVADFIQRHKRHAYEPEASEKLQALTKLK